jgi:hypothetical protein
VPIGSLPSDTEAAERLCRLNDHRARSAACDSALLQRFATARRLQDVRAENADAPPEIARENLYRNRVSEYKNAI